MNIAKINSEFKIVRVDKFKFKADYGYITKKGYALYHDEFGFFTFDSIDLNGRVPYVPCGGKRALTEILSCGGLTDFNINNFIRPMN